MEGGNTKGKMGKWGSACSNVHTMHHSMYAQTIMCNSSKPFLQQLISVRCGITYVRFEYFPTDRSSRRVLRRIRNDNWYSTHEDADGKAEARCHVRPIISMKSYR